MSSDIANHFPFWRKKKKTKIVNFKLPLVFFSHCKPVYRSKYIHMRTTEEITVALCFSHSSHTNELCLHINKKWTSSLGTSQFYMVQYVPLHCRVLQKL